MTKLLNLLKLCKNQTYAAWCLCVFFLACSSLGNAQGGYEAPYITAAKVSKYEVKVVVGGHYDTIYWVKESRNGAYTRTISTERPIGFSKVLTVSSEGVYKYEMEFVGVDQLKRRLSASVEVIFPPVGPSSVSVSSTSVEVGDTVTITWPAVSGADEYAISMIDSSGNWTTLGGVDQAQPKSFPFQMENIGTYTFRVQACKDSDFTESGACDDGSESPAVNVEGRAFDLDSHGYSVFSGDFYRNDGVTDYYFYSREQLLILHGDIATPILLPAHPTFVIRGVKSGPDSPWVHTSPVAESLTDFEVFGLTQLKEGVDYYVGDFNGDGKLDFLFRGQQSGAEQPYIVYGVNQFTLPSSVYNFSVLDGEITGLISNRSNSLYVKDVNGDGADDLVLKSGSSLVADTAYLSVSGAPKTKFEMTDPESKYVNLAGLGQSVFEVSTGGAATYEIPLSLPKGPGGIVPRLSLNYSSSAGNGPLGQGWSIAGLSSVERCRQTIAGDDVSAEMGFAGVDSRYCLDGQKLIAQGSSDYGSLNNTYKTEIDSFVSVKPINGAAGNPDQFEVTHKDGSVYVYGKVASHRFEGYKGTFKWYLSEYKDIAGNEVHYSYLNDDDGIRIKSISYGGNDVSSDLYKVVFDYEDRLDPVLSRHAYSALGLSKRVSKITVRNETDELRSYSVRYLLERVDRNVPALSRVDHIQECVVNSCLEPHRFTWTPEAVGGLESEQVQRDFSTHHHRGKVADINADGRDDYVWFRKTDSGSFYWRVSISNGSELILQPANSYDKVNSLAAATWHLVDQDGDGLLDVMYLRTDGVYVQHFDGQAFGQPVKITNLPPEYAESIETYTGSGGGLISEMFNSIMVENASQRFVIQDLDGDGIPDLVLQSETETETVISVRSGIQNSEGKFIFSTAPIDELSYSRQCQFNFGGAVVSGERAVQALGSRIVNDREGDGITELLTYNKCSGGGAVDSNWNALSVSGGELEDRGLIIDLGNIVDAVIPADFNSDGRLDLLYRKDEGSYGGITWLSVMSGRAGSYESNNYVSRTPLEELPDEQVMVSDYNHDGFNDLVWPSNTLQVKLWNPEKDAFGSTISTSVPSNYKNGRQHFFMDLNGDGYKEYVTLKSTDDDGHFIRYSYTNNEFVVRNKIREFHNGDKNKHKVTYNALTDKNAKIYTALSGGRSIDDDSAVYDLNVPSYVVSKVERSAPVPENLNATSLTSYKYEGLRVQAGGRGSLGFSKLTKHDETAGTKTIVTFAQKFPYTGMVLNETLVSGAGKILSKVVNTLSYKRTGNGKPYWPYVDISTKEIYALKSDGAETGALKTKVVTDRDFDGFGNLEFEDVKSYDGSGSLVSRVETDHEYGVESWKRTLGRVERTTVSTTVGNDTATRVADFKYFETGESKGFLRHEIIEPNSDIAKQGVKTTYEYDSFGNRKSEQKSVAGEAARKTRTVYDSSGRYVQYAYDAEGRLVTEVAQVNTWGRPTEIRNYLDVSEQSFTTTSIQYDVLGREVSRSNSIGESVSTTYRRCQTGCINGASYYVEKLSNTGAKSTVYYNAIGQKLRDESLGLGSKRIFIDYKYDSLGRLVQQSEPYLYPQVAGLWNVNQYDLLGRVTRTDLASGYFTKVDYDNNHSNGIATVTTNEAGQSKTEVKNAVGQLVYVEDNIGGRIRYKYDARGNLRFITQLGTTSKPLNHVVEMRYDKFDRKNYVSDPDKGIWHYTHNGYGELQTQTDSLGNQIVNQYDVHGRLVNRLDKDSAGNVESQTHWYYDDKDPAGNSVPYALGKVTAVVMTRDESEVLCSDPTAFYCATKSYNDNGQEELSAVSLGLAGDDGSYVEQTAYDAYGRAYRHYDVLDGVIQREGAGISSGTQAYYDAAGQLESIADLDQAGYEILRNRTANARGQILRSDLSDGYIALTNGYDPTTGRLTSQSADATGSNLQGMSYTWTPVGNLETRYNSRRNLKEAFCYDGLNRLEHTLPGTLDASGCSSVTPDDRDQYYDSIGNLLHKKGMGTYAYDPAKPHAVTSTDQIDTLNYDAVGNLKDDATGRVVEYTAFNKPKKISRNGDVVEFFYGPDRARYKRVDTRSDGTVTETLYLGNVQRIENTVAGNVTWKRYLAGGAVFSYKSDLAGNEQSVTRQFALTDHIGSTNIIVSSTGQLVSEHSFNPWGQRRAANDWAHDYSVAELIGGAYQLLDQLNETTTDGFTGHEMVDALGIVHMNGRIYDPILGRFLQADPVIDGMTDTQGYNRYSYVQNNPLTLTDPNGFSSSGSGVGYVGITIGTNGVGLQVNNNSAFISSQEDGNDAPEGTGKGAYRKSGNGVISEVVVQSSSQSGVNARASDETVEHLALNDDRLPGSTANPPFLMRDDVRNIMQVVGDGAGRVTETAIVLSGVTAITEAGVGTVVEARAGDIVGSAKNLLKGTGKFFSGRARTLVDFFSGFGRVTKGESTTLYRAVSQGELKDISKNGFRMGNNAMGNKWFAESAEDAAAWGQKFFKWDKEPVWTLKVTLPKSTADTFGRRSSLDGIGPARSADAGQLKALNANADVKVLMGNALKN